MRVPVYDMTGSFYLDPYEPSDGSFPGLVPTPPLLRSILLDEAIPSTNTPSEAFLVSLGIMATFLEYPFFPVVPWYI